jgi:hypothetical protein
MLLTFYYLNREEVDRQYAQTERYTISALEEYIANETRAKGKLSLGGFFTFLGINLGDVEASGAWDRTSSKKVLKTLSTEQKLALVWRHLQRKGELVIIDSASRSGLTVGEAVVFEGVFALSKQSEKTARLEGEIDGSQITISFSLEKMPESIYNALQLDVSDIPLSGYGMIMKIDERGILLRPVAFGLNFSKVLMKA